MMREDPMSEEDDGSISLDWHTLDRDMLSISISQEGVAAFAWLKKDGAKGHGTAKLDMAVFEILKKAYHEDCDSD